MSAEDLQRLRDLLETRRSVRAFKPEPPTRADIEAVLEQAVLAPSASNKQPWRFLIVTDKTTIAAMAAAVREAIQTIRRHIPPASEEAFLAYGSYFTRFEAAPAVIVPIHRGHRVLSHLVSNALPASTQAAIAAMERDSGLIGTSLALMNLLLAAHAAGLGASAMTGPLVAYDALKEILRVPASWGIVALVPLGYPDEAPRRTDRKSLGKVVKWIEADE